MQALLVSTGVVALAQIGDKTQLLAFLLAARLRKPLPIVAGILVATLVNHGLAGALGAWITAAVPPEILRWPNERHAGSARVTEAQTSWGYLWG